MSRHAGPRGASPVRRVTLVLLCAAAVVCGLVLVIHGDRSLAGTPHAAPLPGAAARGTARASAHVAASGSPANVQAARAGPTLAIPALSVRAAVVGATVEDGVLEPPRNPAEVGMWGGSAGLGARTGTVTIAGHVNWAGMSAFAFADLASLRPGAHVYTTAGGRRQSWRVSSVSARPKSAGIVDAAFGGRDGARRLVLITCGGSFDPTARSYLDNVYVFAVPTR